MTKTEHLRNFEDVFIMLCIRCCPPARHIFVHDVLNFCRPNGLSLNRCKGKNFLFDDIEECFGLSK